MRFRDLLALWVLWAVSACAAGVEAREVPRELRELRILALAPSDGRVVVRDGSGSLHVLAVGDPVPMTRERPPSDGSAPPLEIVPTVTRIEASRLVLLMATEDGPCEVWVDPADGRGKDRMRALCSTTEESTELSKPLIQPISSMLATGESADEADASSPEDSSPEASETAPETSGELAP